MEQLNLEHNVGALMQPPMPSRQLSRSQRRSAAAESRPTEAVGNVTEIIMARGQVENLQLLLPMLTQLNDERRWLAWIDPPQSMMARWQNTHGILADEILVLHSSEHHDALDLAEKALRAGTCHAVVTWTEEKVSGSAFQRMQLASAAGGSHGVILRQR